MGFKLSNTNNQGVQVSECGKFKGVGSWSPYRRAQFYNWYRYKLKGHYGEPERRYLEAYEHVYGKLHEGNYGID